jgi:hypothetical protein
MKGYLSMQKVYSFVTSRRFTPWLLLLLTLLSFGLMVPFLSYFMDDWYLIWFKHTFGALQYPAYFALDRPLMGYFYIPINALLFNSESPIVWNIFGLFMRWVSTLAIWQFLNTLWPKNNKQNTWVALLAAVFPGFTQHSFIVMYSFSYFCLAGIFFSFTLMIKALRSQPKKWILIIASLIIGFYSYGANEYFSGLELIRPVIIWLVLSNSVSNKRNRLITSIKYWLPFFGVYLAYIIWRTFFFVSMVHEVTIINQFGLSPGNVILGTFRKIIQSIFESTAKTWTQIFDLNNYPSSGKTGLSIILLAVVVFTSLALWLRSQNRQISSTDGDSVDTWGKQSFWLGVVSLVVTILPFWAADLEVSTRYPYDRFLLAFLFGSCLLVAGLINQFARNQKLQVISLSLLIAASAAFQANLMVRYKNLSDFQRNLIWQLVWRAPDLKPGTAILANDFPNQNYLAGNALSTEIDWIYSKTQPPNKKGLDYLFVFLNSPTRDSIDEMAPGKKIDYDFRGYQFHGNTDNTFLVGLKSNGCLRVLDNQLTPIFTVFDLYSKQVQDGAAISNLNPIVTDAEQKIPPQYLFGSEPAHTWCFYFEKAELARQVGDYAQAYSLIQQANQQGYYPKDLTEWYSFIDGALHTGHFDEAVELSSRIIVNEAVVQDGVCNTWENYINSLPMGEVERLKVKQQLANMECN